MQYFTSGSALFNRILKDTDLYHDMDPVKDTASSKLTKIMGKPNVFMQKEICYNWFKRNSTKKG